jgi:C1A family cysteine protease
MKTVAVSILVREFAVLLTILLIVGTLAFPPAVASATHVSNTNYSSDSLFRAQSSQSFDLSDTNGTMTFGLGALPEQIPDGARLRSPTAAGILPTHFDWRNNLGYNWMTPVQSQGSCGSCVAFGAVAALEGQLKIQGNNPSWNIDLSEAHLFSCGGGSCTSGWYVSSALNYLEEYGTPDEACAPYRSTSVSCANSCSDWQSRAYKIRSWNWIAPDPSAIEAALLNGPLVARFDVYSDFLTYTSGVYHHTSGDLKGGHAVALVGYDSVERYWIAKNSWGAPWGESGYFRIGFGEAGIDDAVASIRAETAPVRYTVTFYSTPVEAAVSADGVVKPNGEGASYDANQRVHVIANAPSGYQFSGWEASGVSVDNLSSSDTYITVLSDGSLRADFSPASGTALSNLLSAPPRTVYFIFPDGNHAHPKPTGVGYASVTDWTALGYVYGMMTNMPQIAALDTNSTYVDQATGAPKLKNSFIVLFGGPLVNSLVHYYEENRIAPLWWSLEGGWTSGTEHYRTRSGAEAASMTIQSLATGSSDMMLIEAFTDPNQNTVLVFSGFGSSGTFASGLYSKAVLCQGGNLAGLSDSWYFYSWTDKNGNVFVEDYEVNPIASNHGN